MQKALVWSTETRKIDDLIPHAKNPRKISDKERKDLETSINRYNLVEIPAINTDNGILAGHARLRIMQALGRGKEEIDVRVPNRKLTTKECEEYLLRSNKNTGSWDYDLLKAFDTEFLLDIGFDDTDLSNIWDDVLEIEDDDFDEKKEMEEAKKTDIKEGNLFSLGDHFLICGDSTDKAVAKRLVGNHKIDMAYSDPPYNISLDYNKGLGGKANYGGDVDDKKTDVEYREFLRKAMTSALSVSAENAHHFWYCDQKYVGMLQMLFEELGIGYKRTALWVKNGINVTPQVAFSKLYEPCVYGTTGKPYLSPKHTKFAEILNKDIGIGNATIDDITDMIDIWLAKRISGDEYEHPTQKPLSLHERPLNRCTKIGDNVLDLFGGSGSTLLACEQMKRRAFLVEKSPIFCQLIINRYEKFTGHKAKQLD
ncbi:MAG: DNA modification methylase [Candidatus Parcubacteria bacterium]|nr:DNA modification methylase [Candidatus Parcubacteria bacterium]